MTTEEEPTNKALKIVRWCWPKKKWFALLPVEDEVARQEGHFYFSGPEWSIKDWNNIHAAEEVVEKRGLAEQYEMAIEFLLEPRRHFLLASKESRVKALLKLVEEHPL